MATSHSIQKKWIESFTKCPLVNRDTKTFNKAFAHQLFYGRTSDDYPLNYPEGYRKFYDTHFELDRDSAIETVLKFLQFIGIRLKYEMVQQHMSTSPADFHTLLKKTYYLLRTLAHCPLDFNIERPYTDNYGDIMFLIRVETGQGQLSIFEVDLPQLYGRNAHIPDGYENDTVALNLFSQIENSHESIFITGKAGTGKSTFIHYFTQKTKKKVLLTAFTGIAAMNVGGVTIHSFFQFPLRPLLPGDEEIKIFSDVDQRRKIIHDLDTIIIDEVSMLRADILQAIDYSLRNNGGDPNQLFGGKQLIFVGDLFQLPPVTDDTEEVERYLFRELYNGHYFFDCDAYHQVAPTFFEFKKAYRQKEDLEFVELLDSVRDCSADQPILNKLNERFDPSYIPKADEFVITLSSNNYIANAENDKKLLELPTQTYEFTATITGDFKMDRLPTNVLLVLKKYAQVIFVKNDSSGQRRWVNGTIGKIEFIAEDVITVKLPDGKAYDISKEVWEHRGYKYDRAKGKIVSEVKGTFTQYPIKLAWAITIHKSQGLTFDNVIVDLGSGAFVNGQLYTALSRCRKLTGLKLRKRIRKEDIIQDPRIMEFYRKCSNQ